jgi:iron complex outermembrane receptor protein
MRTSVKSMQVREVCMVERHGPRWLALGMVVLLLARVSPAFGDARDEARRHFQEGMSLIRAGNYDEGTAELYEAYRILPHPAVLFNIGRALFDAGQYERAIEELERYVETEPADKDEVERLIEAARARLRQQTAGQGEAAQPDRAPSPTAGSSAGGGAVSKELAILRRQLEETLDRIDTLQRTVGPSNDPSARAAATGDRRASGGTRLAASGIVPVAAGPAREDTVSQGSAGPLDDPYAPIVITSSRYGQSTLDAPNALTIVTGEELRASGVTSIPDLLRRVPGVDVMATGPGDYNIGIRGFNDRLANKVLVLIDGRSVYLDNIGATFWPLLPISGADVERIEVVRGPGAALYGANAFSGVINIITRTPGLASDQPVAEVWAGFPEQGGASLRLSDRVGPTAYRASFGVERKRRWYHEIDPDRPEYEVVAPHEEDAVRVGRFDLRLDHRISRETSVSVSGGVAGGQNEFVAIGALRDFYVDGFQTHLRTDLILPEGFSARAFWHHSSFAADQWTRPVGGLSLATHPITDVIDVEVESFREVDLGIVQRINIGAGYRYKTASWNWIEEDADEHHVSVFFQDEARLAEKLSLIASLRLDRHPLLVEIDDADFTERYAFSPRGALVWRLLPGHSIHATVGTAFRTPTFLESYIATAIPTATDAVVVRNTGNRELLPERVVATEIGWRSEPSTSRYRFDAAAYFNRISSLIELSELQPWPAGESNYDPRAGVWYAGETTFVNGDDDYDAIGIELGGKIFPADGLDLYASGTYQKIDVGGESIENSSPLKLSAGAQVRGRGFTVGGDLHYVSAQTWGLRSFDDGGQIMVTDVDLPAYVWAGARLSYLIPQSRLELAIAGQNLLSPLQEAVRPADGDMSQVTTPQGTHREHPLGQPIPLTVNATMTYRLW